MMPPECNQGLKEELDTHARQRLFSEQVNDPTAGQVGYQSSKFALIVN